MHASGGAQRWAAARRGTARRARTARVKGTTCLHSTSRGRVDDSSAPASPAMWLIGVTLKSIHPHGSGMSCFCFYSSSTRLPQCLPPTIASPRPLKRQSVAWSMQCSRVHRAIFPSAWGKQKMITSWRLKKPSEQLCMHDRTGGATICGLSTSNGIVKQNRWIPAHPDPLNQPARVHGRVEDKETWQSTCRGVKMLP